MVAELNVLSEWIPEQMLPGTIFVLSTGYAVSRPAARRVRSASECRVVTRTRLAPGTPFRSQ